MTETNWKSIIKGKCFTKLLLIFVILLSSCGKTSKLLYQTQTDKIWFIKTSKSIFLKRTKGLYARVDSSNVQIHYSFLPHNIYKTYGNNKNYIYTLVEDKTPMLPLTRIDSVVFKKANALIDSLGYKESRKADRATGFVIEIARH
jgi:hypothetical protein